jgi:hypothetical protein
MAAVCYLENIEQRKNGVLRKGVCSKTIQYRRDHSRPKGLPPGYVIVFVGHENKRPD